MLANPQPQQQPGAQDAFANDIFSEFLAGDSVPQQQDQPAQMLMDDYPEPSGMHDNTNTSLRSRVRLSLKQVDRLKQVFAVQRTPSTQERLKLAKELGLQPRTITIWFQNRRAKLKRQSAHSDHRASGDKLHLQRAVDGFHPIAIAPAPATNSFQRRLTASYSLPNLIPASPTGLSGLSMSRAQSMESFTSAVTQFRPASHFTSTSITNAPSMDSLPIMADDMVMDQGCDWSNFGEMEMRMPYTEPLLPSQLMTRDFGRMDAMLYDQALEGLLSPLNLNIDDVARREIAGQLTPSIRNHSVEFGVNLPMLAMPEDDDDADMRRIAMQRKNSA